MPRSFLTFTGKCGKSVFFSCFCVLSSIFEGNFHKINKITSFEKRRVQPENIFHNKNKISVKALLLKKKSDYSLKNKNVFNAISL